MVISSPSIYLWIYIGFFPRFLHSSIDVNRNTTWSDLFSLLMILWGLHLHVYTFTLSRFNFIFICVFYSDSYIFPETSSSFSHSFFFVCFTVCLVFYSLLLFCFTSLFANLSFSLLILFPVFVFIRLLLPRFIFTSLLPFFSFVFLTFISYLFFCILFSPLSYGIFTIRLSFHSPFISLPALLPFSIYSFF